MAVVVRVEEGGSILTPGTHQQQRILTTIMNAMNVADQLSYIQRDERVHKDEGNQLVWNFRRGNRGDCYLYSYFCI